MSLGVFTVTVAGVERYDGEKPYVYVLTALDAAQAGNAVVALFAREQGTDDVQLLSVEAGAPPAGCGYGFNDLRELPALYALELSDRQWEELEALVGDLFPVASSMPRRAWIAIGYMALGKAWRIKRGYFGDEDTPGDDASWHADLRGLADVVFDFFQPGDGKL